MTYINLTNITNANSTLEQMIAIDRDVTGGWFAILMIIALFVVILIALSFYNVSSAFLTASFFVTVVSGLMWISGFVPLIVPVTALVFVVIGTILALMTKA